jgi:hypothetical protein
MAMNERVGSAQVNVGAFDALASAIQRVPRRPPGKPREPGKDRWGMDPPRRGWVRGIIQNVTRSVEQTPYGELVILDFDIYPDDDAAPLVEVRMSGYTFSKDPKANLLVEVKVGATMPTERIAVDLMKLPYDPDNDVRAYRPVERRQSMNEASTLRKIATVLIPSTIIMVFTLFLHFYAHAF